MLLLQIQYSQWFWEQPSLLSYVFHPDIPVTFWAGVSWMETHQISGARPTLFNITAAKAVFWRQKIHFSALIMLNNDT